MEEYKQIIETEEAKYPELAALSSSNFEVWNWAKNVIAFLASHMAGLLQAHKQEVEGMIATQELGNITWYEQKAYEYQHGDKLVLRENVPGYATTDTTRQVVKHCAVIEQPDGLLVFKVAGNDGNITPLSSEEQAGLAEYLSRVKFAGTRVQVQSHPADVVRYTIEVEADPKIIDSTGARIDGTNPDVVTAAIKAYHEAIDFGGTLYLSRLIDSIQQQEGIIDAHITLAQYLEAGQWKTINRKWVSPAGYVIESGTTINYV